MIYICNFHVLNDLLLIYICKLHWNLQDLCVCVCLINTLPVTDSSRPHRIRPSDVRDFRGNIITQDIQEILVVGMYFPCLK